MENSSLSDKKKMPGILTLFCVSTALGFLYNLSSILTMDKQFQFFYACYLIFPILELIGVFNRSNKILFVGFYGTIFFRLIEYSYAGYTYGFNRLFSTFGTNIAGYFISLAIWWSYFYFSKKAADYFDVVRATTLISRKATLSASSPSILPSLSPNLKADDKSSVESFISVSSKSELTNQSSASASNHRHLRIIAIALLLVLSIALAIFCVYEHTLYQNSLLQIQSLSNDISSLESENNNLNEQINALQSENDSLQSESSDAFVTACELNFLKNSIRFVLDDGTKYYHTYDCPVYQNHSGTYWIHNPEYCDYLGYNPCPVCLP